MKNLIAFFSMLLLFAACNKDANVEPSTENEDVNNSVTVEFTASIVEMVESKAITFTEGWSESDQIIIFVDGQESGYIYNVESDGTMSADDTAISGSAETKQSYYAFTPVNSAFTTLAEYEAATPRDDEDLLSAVASGTSSVDFSFSHDLAALFFEMESESSITSAKVTDGDTEYTLDLEIDGLSISSSLFVAPQSDLSSANLIVTSSAGTTTIPLETSSFTEWSAGRYYIYRDVVIGDIIGDGTSSNPFRVYTAADLAKVGSAIDGWDLDKYYKMMTNVDLEGSEENQWDPIGYTEQNSTTDDNQFDSESFTGQFDGNGYTVSGLYINSTERFQGLFAFCEEATICNLTVEGSVTSTSSNCGGIAGMSKSTNIVNCHNRADVTGTSRVGGITGGAGGYGTYYIANCSNSGTIIGNDYSESDYSDEMTMRVGGITGTSAITVISNCYNVGKVSNTAPSGEAYAIAAPSGDDDFSQSVSNCYYSDDCGGIDPAGTSIACSQSYMQSSEFVAELNSNNLEAGTAVSYYYGIAVREWEIGDNGYPTTNRYEIEFEKMFSNGDGSSDNPYLISSARELRNLSSLYQTYNYNYTYYKLTCDIDLEGSEENPWTPIGWIEDENTGVVFYGLFDGGGHTISGLYINTTAQYQGLFAACFGVICDLTVEGSITSTGANCGGITGYSIFCLFLNCHNRADITGANQVGGIAGDSYSQDGGFILNCSNSGTIIGNGYSESEETTMQVGGIAGSNNFNVVANCYNIGNVSIADPLGNAYAIAPTYASDPSYLNITYCYHIDDCNGVDPLELSTAYSDSYMQSSEFITLLNGDILTDMNEFVENYYSDLNYEVSAKEWEIGDNGYPTTK
ncbi:MAG: hypothetical protein R3Y44_03335 [Rikenellaceae bacterium]